jgi:hypothetical protein
MGRCVLPRIHIHNLLGSEDGEELPGQMNGGSIAGSDTGSSRTIRVGIARPPQGGRKLKADRRAGGAPGGKKTIPDRRIRRQTRAPILERRKRRQQRCRWARSESRAPEEGARGACRLCARRSGKGIQEAHPVRPDGRARTLGSGRAASRGWRRHKGRATGQRRGRANSAASRISLQHGRMPAPKRGSGMTARRRAAYGRRKRRIAAPAAELRWVGSTGAPAGAAKGGSLECAWLEGKEVKSAATPVMCAEAGMAHSQTSTRHRKKRSFIPGIEREEREGEEGG